MFVPKANNMRVGNMDAMLGAGMRTVSLMLDVLYAAPTIPGAVCMARETAPFSGVSCSNFYRSFGDRKTMEERLVMSTVMVPLGP
jgi:hypothetical protein